MDVLSASARSIVAPPPTSVTLLEPELGPGAKLGRLPVRARTVVAGALIAATLSGCAISTPGQPAARQAGPPAPAVAPVPATEPAAAAAPATRQQPPTAPPSTTPQPASQTLPATIGGVAGRAECRVPAGTVGAGKLIVVSIRCQHMTAYQDGRVVVDTNVTTGRPALPTPTGSYSVTSKDHPWTFHSGRAPSDPYWYAPVTANYALWWKGGKDYAMHDSPWRSAYGPGTQAQGSHGCVNTPLTAERTLYRWAPVGTRVVVTP
ncbi:MAG: L,D-transpeptidase [Candidatus Dormibacteria bacterium]